MGKENNIHLNSEQLKTFSNDLEEAFKVYSQKPIKFTGYKDKMYELLGDAIYKTTQIRLGNSTLRNIITLTHDGNFQRKTFEAIDKFIVTYTKKPRSFMHKLYIEPIKQKVFWSVNQDYAPGIFINSFKGEFIEWNILKNELDTKVIPQLPRIFPVGSKVKLKDFYGKKDFLVRIYDAKDNELGSVWLGGNPLKNWYVDGLIRVGKGHSNTLREVYMIFQRYSDGSYRVVKSFI